MADLKTSDLLNRDSKLTIDYNIVIQNNISSFDDEIYVDLEFMNEFKNFELKDRKVAYELSYKTNYVSQINLKIPEGYKVTKMPTNLSIKENDFDISLNFENTGKEIIYKKSFVFKNGMIKATDIEKWNESVKKIAENYNQQITLSK